MSASATGDHTTLTRISNPTVLLAARIVVIVIGLLSLVSFVSVNSAALQVAQNLPPETQIGLEQVGVSLTLYTAIIVGLRVIFGIIGLVVGGFILLRRSDDRMSLLTAVFLMTFSSAFLSISTEAYLEYTTPLTGAIGVITSLIGWSLIEVIFVLFPDGKVAFRWLYIPIILQITLASLYNLAPDNAFHPIHWSPLVLALLIVSEIIGAGISMVWKFRHTMTPAQRQQTKWPAMGGFISAVVYVTSFFVPVIFPQVATDPGAKVVFELYTAVVSFGLIAFPLSLAFAILHYRLWDIDLMVNRSLVYSVILGLILVVFFVVSLVVQTVMGSQQIGISLVISVIIAALAFNPARHMVQNLVDRHIYHLNFDLNQLAAAQKLPDIQNPGALSGRKLGEYEVLDVIGKGGMGEVYKGQSNGKTFALKILPDDLAVQEDFRKRFEREGQALTGLHHPNIVKIYGSGASDGIAYLAMEYVDGQELGRKIKSEGALSMEDTSDILRGLADALDYAHEQGLVHRDIKPSNVMIRKSSDGETWDAVLMDFGVAKMKEAQTGLTGTGAIGTIDYMAPEQITAAREVDQRADIYALGAMVYEMLTGERPFKGSAAQILFAHLQQPPPDPRDVRENVPREMARAVMQAMAKKPEERFATAGEFASALG